MMDYKIINFTKDNYLNHKKDKIFSQTFIDNAKLFLFITKSYKIIKILTMKHITYLICSISVKF